MKEIEGYKKLKPVIGKLKKTNENLRKENRKLADLGEDLKLENEKLKAHDPLSMNCRVGSNSRGPLSFEAFRLIVDFVGECGVPESGVDSVNT